MLPWTKNKRSCNFSNKIYDFLKLELLGLYHEMTGDSDSSKAVFQ